MRNHFRSFSIALLLSLSSVQAHAGESYGNPEDPVVAEVLGMQIRTKNPEEMQYVINQKLILDYAQKNNIEASREDVDLYIATMDHLAREDRSKSDARGAEIQRQLKSGTLPAEKTKQLQSELDILEQIHQYDLQGERE